MAAGGAIAGIVVVVSVVIGALALLAWCLWRRQKRRGPEKRSNSPSSIDVGSLQHQTSMQRFKASFKRNPKVSSNESRDPADRIVARSHYSRGGDQVAAENKSHTAARTPDADRSAQGARPLSSLAHMPTSAYCMSPEAASYTDAPTSADGGLVPDHASAMPSPQSAAERAHSRGTAAKYTGAVLPATASSAYYSAAAAAQVDERGDDAEESIVLPEAQRPGQEPRVVPPTVNPNASPIMPPARAVCSPVQSVTSERATGSVTGPSATLRIMPQQTQTSDVPLAERSDAAQQMERDISNTGKPPMAPTATAPYVPGGATGKAAAAQPVPDLQPVQRVTSPPPRTPVNPRNDPVQPTSGAGTSGPNTPQGASATAGATTGTSTETTDSGGKTGATAQRRPRRPKSVRIPATRIPLPAPRQSSGTTAAVPPTRPSPRDAAAAASVARSPEGAGASAQLGAAAATPEAAAPAADAAAAAAEPQDGAAAAEGAAPDAGPPDLQRELRKVLSAADELTPVTLQGEIGRGAFGVVYRGTWKNIPVAVKTMMLQPRNKNFVEDPGLREATLALQLVHPNLVATYRANARTLDARLGDLDAQLGDTHAKPNAALPPSYQLVMLQEFCDAGTMYDWLASMKLHPEGVTDKAVIARCALDIARGIQHLHHSHIVHGDLKPQNVMLSSVPPVIRKAESTPGPRNFPYLGKLTDFGLSFHMGNDKSHMSNMKVGTPFYYAPEVQGDGHLSKAADVYSFGVLLWEMYHGMPPYVYSHQKKRLVNNRNFPRFDLRPREEAPFSYVVLTLACLSTEYSKRPVIDDVVTVLEDLNECLNGAPNAAQVMRNASLKRVAKGTYTAGFAAPASLQRQAAGAPAPTATPPAGQPVAGTASAILIDMIKQCGLDRDKELRRRLDQTGADEIIRLAGLQPGEAPRGASGPRRAPARVANPGWTPDIQLVPKDFKERMRAMEAAAPAPQRTPEEEGLSNAYTETLKVMHSKLNAVRAKR